MLGRGEGVVQSRSRGFFELEEQLDLGFHGRAELGSLRESAGRQEVPRAEESPSHGRMFNCGGGAFSCGSKAGLSSRGGHSRAAPGLARHGGRSGAANVGAGDSPVVLHSWTGQGGAASRSASQQTLNPKPLHFPLKFNRECFAAVSFRD